MYLLYMNLSILRLNLAPKLTNCLKTHINAISFIVIGISFVMICLAFIFHEKVYALRNFSSYSKIIHNVHRFLSILVLKKRTTGKKCFT